MSVYSSQPLTDDIAQFEDWYKSSFSGMRIALLIHDLRGGGAERVTVSLANGFASIGLCVDLVLINKTGSESYFNALSPTIRLIELRQSRTLTSGFGFWRYFNIRKPDLIISAMTHVNISSLLANRISSRSAPFIAVEHNQLSRNRSTKNGLVRLAYHLVPWVYRYATIVGAVSEGVKNDLAKTTGIPLDRIQVLYNPVVTTGLLKQSNEHPGNPWFSETEPPVILGVGRLTEQKNFGMLIDAFAAVRSECLARLVILGQGPDYQTLEEKAKRSGYQQDIRLMGFTANPFAYMRHATIVALSSNWEGLPTVLIEAMACGTPVVATDCPSGPAEILRHGELGSLTPVGDTEAFAAAILRTLRCPPAKKEDLQKRAHDFSTEKAVMSYLSTVFTPEGVPGATPSPIDATT